VTLTAETSVVEVFERGDAGVVDDAPEEIPDLAEGEPNAVEEQPVAALEEKLEELDLPAPANPSPLRRRRVGVIARLRSFFTPSPAAVEGSASVLPAVPAVIGTPEAEPEATSADAQAEAGEPVFAASEPEAAESEGASDLPDSEPEAELEVTAFDPHAVLTAALDSLGQAHHRPFSRV
jgi:hypothetical protein